MMYILHSSPLRTKCILFSWNFISILEPSLNDYMIFRTQEPWKWLTSLTAEYGLKCTLRTYTDRNQHVIFFVLPFSVIFPPEPYIKNKVIQFIIHASGKKSPHASYKWAPLVFHASLQLFVSYFNFSCLSPSFTSSIWACCRSSSENVFEKLKSRITFLFPINLGSI